MEDKDLFESATNDEPIEQVEAQAETVQDDGQHRDEQGRFAQKAEEPVVETPVAETPKEEANVPSWRMREIREERDAMERRNNEERAQWQRQIAELQSRLPKAEEPKAPDVFEDPNRFLEHGVQRAVDPINSRIGSVVEKFSMKLAVKEYGQEKVKAAYDWVAGGMQNRNPEIMAVYQRAMASDDPYEEIVGAHQKQTVFSQIGNDPNAWFEKELEKRLADPQFASAQLQKIQAGVRNPSGTQASIVKLPPSIGKVPSSHSASDDVADMSDAGLFAHAMR